MIRCSRQAAVAAVLVVLTTAAGGAAAQGAAAARTLAKPVAKAPPLRWWKPARYTNGTFTRFQYQLSDSGSIPAVYAIDFDTARDAIPALRKKVPGAKVICYFSAGSWEKYRVADDKQYRGINPASWKAAGALGNVMADWPDERWLDVRNKVVRANMVKRIDYCKRIGCDGVDPDNVNFYDDNNPGFPLTAKDAINYMKFLANEAHSRGLAIGLKNCHDIIADVEPLIDWAISEECVVYGYCGDYKALGRGKPVWNIEYCDEWSFFGEPSQRPACFCKRVAALGISTLFKRAELDAPGISCDQYCRHNAACLPATATAGCSAWRDLCGLVPNPAQL
ncbi:hypothetical protein ABPG77_000363 [Micractinium sp. CCAP 211/92]